jgi:ferrous iron transport protein B
MNFAVSRGDDCHDDGSRVAVLDGDFQLALIGSPNAGKTTLFNALTGMRAKTANYPGITVTRREAVADLAGRRVRMVDLPGVYSLTPVSPDEQVVADALHGDLAGVEPPDALVMVADATTLERSLFLVAEVLSLGLPVCLVLTMIDELAARGGTLDVDRLSTALGIPVVGVIGHRGVGIEPLRTLLSTPILWSRPVLMPPTDGRALSGWVASILQSASGLRSTTLRPDDRTKRIDSILLHRVFGVFVFFTVMLGLFQTIFTLAAPVQDSIESVFASLTGHIHTWFPGAVGDFLGDGVIAGVGGVLVFVPQIAFLFLILAVLEKVGYLARAALLADRIMGRFGLEGRSFVALLSSFACAVPGIMATRTIPGERRRLATMMAAPLMTCSARLPVFTLLISGFVGDRAVFGPLRSQGLAMFGLYLLGAVSGLFYAGVLSLFARNELSPPVLLELPPYRMPTLRAVLLHVWDGVWSFVRKAGTTILLTSMMLWALLRFPGSTPPSGLTEAQASSYQMERSIAGRTGKAMEPLFSPLGFEWRTNVAILGSLAAREVFVSTLALTTASQDEASLPDRLRELRTPGGRKVYDAPTVAAILVFFVYALQCTSTIVVLRRETNSKRWPAIAFVSMLALAYVGALIARSMVGLFA